MRVRRELRYSQMDLHPHSPRTRLLESPPSTISYNHHLRAVIYIYGCTRTCYIMHADVKVFIPNCKKPEVLQSIGNSPTYLDDRAGPLHLGPRRRTGQARESSFHSNLSFSFLKIYITVCKQRAHLKIEGYSR